MMLSAICFERCHQASLNFFQFLLFQCLQMLDIIILNVPYKRSVPFPPITCIQVIANYFLSDYKIFYIQQMIHSAKKSHTLSLYLHRERLLQRLNTQSINFMNLFHSKCQYLGGQKDRRPTQLTTTRQHPYTRS